MPDLKPTPALGTCQSCRYYSVINTHLPTYEYPPTHLLRTHTTPAVFNAPPPPSPQSLIACRGSPLPNTRWSPLVFVFVPSVFVFNFSTECQEEKRSGPMPGFDWLHAFDDIFIQSHPSFELKRVELNPCASSKQYRYEEAFFNTCIFVANTCIPTGLYPWQLFLARIDPPPFYCLARVSGAGGAKAIPV